MIYHILYDIIIQIVYYIVNIFLLWRIILDRLNILVSENIKRIRQEKNLSLGDLAKLSDVSKSMLAQIERGEGNKASVFFKLAKDFANLYFQEFQNLSTIWYARALVYDGKIEKGQKILQKYISSNVEAILFYMESYILFSDDPEKLKEKHKEIDTLKQNYNKLLSNTKLQINSFSFLEDFAWYNIYKKTISNAI